MKHLIKIEAVEHGVLGVKHKGLDQQYCEAGERVVIEWQPDAKWGLVEAHFTNAYGIETPIDLKKREFIMPDSDIEVSGTFKRFVLPDWTGDQENEENNVLDWLTAGDITPKSNEPIEITGMFAAETTGGDMDIKNGKAYLQAIKGNLDLELVPFNAAKFVSTGMNLVDPTKYFHRPEYGKRYYFPVTAGVWGQYGTTQENNGYIIIGEGVEDVAFSETFNEGLTGCPYEEYNGVKYYLPPTNGWMYIQVGEDYDVPACHIAWSNYKDNEAGVFGNSEIDLSAAIETVHPWGLAGFVTCSKSVQDVIDIKNGVGYRNCDRVKLADLNWSMSTIVTTDDDNVTTTTYVFTAYVTGMAAYGLCAYNFPDLSNVGNVLDYSSETITSVNAFKAELGDSMIYFEMATPVTVDLPEINGEFEANDFGLTYFLDVDGELVSVPSYVTAAYHQGGKDQLFNAVTYQKILAEVVATALCQLNERVSALETKKTVDCLNLIVGRKFDMKGWRLVDEQPASASAPGRFGDYFIATGFLYICVADNTWKKITISNF